MDTPDNVIPLRNAGDRLIVGDGIKLSPRKVLEEALKDCDRLETVVILGWDKNPNADGLFASSTSVAETNLMLDQFKSELLKG